MQIESNIAKFWKFREKNNFVYHVCTTTPGTCTKPTPSPYKQSASSCLKEMNVKYKKGPTIDHNTKIMLWWLN